MPLPQSPPYVDWTNVLKAITDTPRNHSSAFCLETGWPGGTGSTGNFVPVTSQIVFRVPDVGFFARPSTFCQMTLSKKESCTKVTKNCMKSKNSQVSVKIFNKDKQSKLSVSQSQLKLGEKICLD